MQKQNKTLLVVKVPFAVLQNVEGLSRDQYETVTEYQAGTPNLNYSADV